MVTKIKGQGLGSSKTLMLSPSPITSGGLRLRVGRDVFVQSIHVDRSDFLDAVRSELGVLIIDKADLPEVEERSHYLFAGTTEVMGDLSPALLREKGLSYLALAEHVEAHPPVDEQQVEALVTLLGEHDVYRSQDASIIARTLIRTGKVTVQP